MKRFDLSPKPLRAALSGIGLMLLLAGSLKAQSVWRTNDGDWFTAGNWAGGVPNESVAARFQVTENSPGAVHVSVGSGTATALAFQIFHGKEVQIDLADGAVVSATGQLWRIGWTSGSGGATLQFNGPGTGEATVKLAAVIVGSDAFANDSQLVFSGTGLKVVQETPADYIIVGRFGTNQKMRVENGADVTARYVALSDANVGGGREGHELHVIGEGSRLATVGRLTIGATGEGARDNKAFVSGNGATLSVGDYLTIGTSVGYGGNSLEVSNGGLVEVTGTTTISTYDGNGGDNSGANRLSIRQGGTFKAGSVIVTHGLLQLEEGGVLEAIASPVALSVKNGARVELAGSGLHSNVSVQLESGARMAVGVSDGSGERAGASTLVLGSGVTFANGSVLELSLFDNGGDQIELLSGGALEGTITLELKWLGTTLPSEGWQLFTGAVENITAAFVLSGIDPELWDLSNFNQEGGWEVRAIPEGAVGLYAMFGMALLAYSTFRSKQAPGRS